ncbi:MAG: hypothetical protein WAV28_01935 [Sedimentisphaerales bacterium]|jgi:hypothetical protein
MTPLRPPTISVIEPIGPAFEKVKTILFKPFDLSKWFVIGFCAWLAYLGKGGGGGNGGGRGGGPSEAREAFGEAKVFVLENLAWIIPVALTVVVLIIVLWLVFTWLSSRGRFMFLHCVAENKAEVKVPWTKFQQHANSLFLFRIVLGLIGLGAIGLPCLLAGGLIAIMIAGNIPSVAGVLGIVMIVLTIIAISITFALIGKFTTDFVVPIMFLRTTSCIAGWREFLTILSVNKARFVLYILFRIVIALAIGALVLTAVFVTCCCAACILAIPYIGTVLMLPVLVFKRAYSLLYLGQYGSEFDVFRVETEITLGG